MAQYFYLKGLLFLGFCYMALIEALDNLEV